MRVLLHAASVARDFGDDHIIAAALDGIATIAIATAQLDRAARLVGVTDKLRAQLGHGRSPLPIDREAYDQGIATCRSARPDVTKPGRLGQFSRRTNACRK